MQKVSVHPHERISHALNRLTFLATLLSSSTGDTTVAINFNHPENQDGLYFTLHGIADDIESALNVLISEEVCS